ncbi:glycosyltransferase family 4 protein [Patescibacteria group bacterium]|nr:glycosyltransferase family 4 protein [Candidatus Margulisiibacteriota bacterium]MBU1728067.1 glycosyltransferase family 4 protein [Patescibacteria group bacterium]
MKILFVCENYIPHYGGAEVVFKNLAERYVQKGHQVTILTHQLKGTKKEENLNGVKVIRVPSFHSRYLFTFLSIPKAIKLAKEHDIIQTTSFNGAPPAWIAGKLTKKPVVITVHEVWVNKWKQVTDFSWLKCKIHELLEKAIYLLPYDRYICVSNATKKDLLKINIKKENAITTYNGLDYQFWDEKNFKDEDVKKIKEELNLKNNFVYFSWGRPGTSKGFEYVIKAVPKIVEKLPRSVFLFMTSSNPTYQKKYDQLMDLVKKLELAGFKENIKVIPSVPYEKLGNYIKAANCVVIPSIAEGFGYTTVESIAIGKPVIVSDAGSLPEVVSGKHLVFENKNSAMLAEKVIEMAKGKFQETPLKKFEWEDSVNKYLNIYKELL